MSADDTPLFLEREDFNTRTWERVALHAQARIADLREQNDGNLDDKATARVRGAIAELKNLLALAEPPAPASSGDGSE